MSASSVEAPHNKRRHTNSFPGQWQQFHPIWRELKAQFRSCTVTLSGWVLCLRSLEWKSHMDFVSTFLCLQMDLIERMLSVGYLMKISDSSLLLMFPRLLRWIWLNKVYCHFWIRRLITCMSVILLPIKRNISFPTNAFDAGRNTVLKHSNRIGICFY